MEYEATISSTERRALVVCPCELSNLRQECASNNLAILMRVEKLLYSTWTGGVSGGPQGKGPQPSRRAEISLSLSFSAGRIKEVICLAALRFVSLGLGAEGSENVYAAPADSWERRDRKWIAELIESL